jgi:hypothetical protein
MGLERQTRPVERLRLEKLSRDPLESLCFARTYAKVAVEVPEDVLADHPRLREDCNPGPHDRSDGMINGGKERR